MVTKKWTISHIPTCSRSSNSSQTLLSLIQTMFVPWMLENKGKDPIEENDETILLLVCSHIIWCIEQELKGTHYALTYKEVVPENIQLASLLHQMNSIHYSPYSIEKRIILSKIPPSGMESGQLVPLDLKGATSSHIGEGIVQSLNRSY